MLRVSWPKYLFDPLQQLLSPSTNDDRPWSHRHLLRSMQAEHQIRLCTNSVKDLWSERRLYKLRWVLLYWSVDQYNNVEKGDRLSGKVWQVARVQERTILRQHKGCKLIIKRIQSRMSIKVECMKIYSTQNKKQSTFLTRRTGGWLPSHGRYEGEEKNYFLL